jgi:hypothetical protein
VVIAINPMTAQGMIDLGKMEINDNEKKEARKRQFKVLTDDE